LQSSN